MLHALILFLVFDHFLTHIGPHLSQSHFRTKERTKQRLFLERTPNMTILLINIHTECEMCCIAEENFVRKIAFYRPSPFLQQVLIIFMCCVIVKRSIFINVRLSTEKKNLVWQMSNSSRILLKSRNGELYIYNN